MLALLQVERAHDISVGKNGIAVAADGGLWLLSPQTLATKVSYSSRYLPGVFVTHGKDVWLTPLVSDAGRFEARISG